jgi:curved DNA-binding protein CbpA
MMTSKKPIASQRSCIIQVRFFPFIFNASNFESEVYFIICFFFLTDRFPNESDEVKQEEEKKFKEVGEAYAVLSDAKKRSRYDAGHDIDELDGHGHGGGGDIDPNVLFQAFFGGGGGPSPFMFQQGGGGGGGGGGGRSRGGAGFPGGFQFNFG